MQWSAHLHVIKAVSRWIRAKFRRRLGPSARNVSCGCCTVPSGGTRVTIKLSTGLTISVFNTWNAEVKERRKQTVKKYDNSTAKFHNATCHRKRRTPIIGPFVANGMLWAYKPLQFAQISLHDRLLSREQHAPTEYVSIMSTDIDGTELC